jgi:hypothetical protein
MELRALDCYAEGLTKPIKRAEKIAVFGSVANYKRLLDSGTTRQFWIGNQHLLRGLGLDLGVVLSMRWCEPNALDK